jgi:hypothetical protein
MGHIRGASQSIGGRVIMLCHNTKEGRIESERLSMVQSICPRCKKGRGNRQRSIKVCQCPEFWQDYRANLRDVSILQLPHILEALQMEFNECYPTIGTDIGMYKKI